MYVSFSSVRMVSLIAFMLLGLSNFPEPRYVVYDINNQEVDAALTELRMCLSIENDACIVAKCKAQRIKRIQLLNDAANQIVCS